MPTYSRLCSHPRIVALLGTAIALLLVSIPSRHVLAKKPAADSKLDFNRDIRPILSDNCFRCHGPDATHRESGLRLDLREAATAAADSGDIAIVAGKPEESALVTRILSDDESVRMPPTEANKELSARQKHLLRQWIAEGAEYAPHWSLIPPKKTAPPEVSNLRWVRNEIDQFILARLESEELEPSREANRAMLIRRASFDLLGLPPSAEEVEAFVSDSEEGAYERLIDRLLASPHFGERMALDWLDAARYADTNGFSIDGGRHMWLWRDWVIHAFNSGMRYDQFLLEQIAGDLLPQPTDSQLIATGFQRNNMVTHEGGTIPEENLTNYNADRVKTLGEAVLGLTLGCAQCHDHKYDPITHKDYYQLFAYFNTTSDIGLDGNGGTNPRPSFTTRTVLQTGEEHQIEQELVHLRAKLADIDHSEFANWEAEQRAELAARGKALELHPVQVLKISNPEDSSAFAIEDQRLVTIKQGNGIAAYDVLIRLPETEQPITALRYTFHPDAALADGWGYGPTVRKSRSRAAKNSLAARESKGNFVLSAVSASADEIPGDQVDLHHLLTVRKATANTWRSDFHPVNCLDTRTDNGWSPDLSHEGPAVLTTTFVESLRAETTPFVTTQFNFGFGDSFVASRIEIQAVTGVDDGSTLPKDIITVLETSAKERTPEQTATLRDFFVANAEATKPLRIAIANLEERLATLTNKFPTMVMDLSKKPRETFILERGNYAQPTTKVTANTPAVLPPPPKGATEDRLGLAQWVIMREHPLTARVYVNRLWQMLFAVGLVETTADFGAQGAWPSHPELLDWLAVDFMEHDWDVKRLLRMMMLSSTYRQTSQASAKLLDRDPANRLLARGPRFRLPAEFIRDSALKTSGLLVPRLGGPSVYPYAPGDLWREISHYGSTPATAQTFIQDHGEKLYRRSLYTYWKRSAPPPNMAVFDAPTRETCVVSRPVTNTPLQSLVLLNDVQYVEAARAFAERILTHASDDDQRLRWAFLESLSRPPTDKELRVCKAALERERRYYADHEQAAREYLASGESPRNEKLPPAEHAAWAQIATILFNLSEAVTRN